MSDDRRKRDLELLMKSRKAMEDEQLNGRVEEAAPAAPAQDDDVVMYRGKAVRRSGNGPKIPGAGGGGRGGATQFRGAKTGGDKAAPDIKAVLKRLDELHREGLITKSEYDKKRLQILDRL